MFCYFDNDQKSAAPEGCATVGGVAGLKEVLMRKAFAIKALLDKPAVAPESSSIHRRRSGGSFRDAAALHLRVPVAGFLQGINELLPRIAAAKNDRPIRRVPGKDGDYRHAVGTQALIVRLISGG